MQITSPLDANLPAVVVKALQPYLTRYASSPPVYTLSPDHSGGFLWVRQASKGELGMGRLCAGYEPTGVTFCDALTPLPQHFLERAKQWCEMYSKSDPFAFGSSTLSFLQLGRALAAELAESLGAKAKVLMFVRFTAQLDIHRDCEWFASDGRNHCHPLAELHRITEFIECLNTLVADPITQLGSKEFDRLTLRLMIPAKHDDWMAVKWLLANSCEHLTGPLPEQWIRP